MYRKLLSIVGVAVVSGCAAGGQANMPADTVSPESGVELVVRNETQSVTTVYVQWEGGRRIRLAELRGGANRTFVTPIRGQEVRVAFAAPGANRDLTADYVPVQRGDRLEWTLQAGRQVFYLRLPSR